jgi:uncharacterized damage-inducible protein DinB
LASANYRMNSSKLLTSLFAYKAWANQQLFSRVMEIDEVAQQERRHNAIRILNHIFTVDRIFVAHLKGEKHAFAATNTPETPSLADLLEGVSTTDQWLLAYVKSTSDETLSEVIEFVFTDGQLAKMSRAEMLMHLITHGGYHRGAVGRILVDCSLKPPKDTLTVFLHASEPERRLRTALA